MSRKGHVQFQGECGGVILQSYPAKESNFSPLSDVHVKCRVSGTGHIRLRLRHKNHTGGNWINRDPAAVADATSGNVRAIWCEDGYLIAYDPSWIFTNLYSS